MGSRKIPDSIQQQVRQRASELCEYCHASEKWQYVLFTSLEEAKARVLNHGQNERVSYTNENGETSARCKST